MTGPSERISAAGAAARRAWLALAALETARTSEDVDRARHGAQHELETVLRVLGLELPALPRGAAGARGRRADHTIVDEELPFDAAMRSALSCGRQDCIAAGGRRFGCTC